MLHAALGCTHPILPEAADEGLPQRLHVGRQRRVSHPPLDCLVTSTESVRPGKKREGGKGEVGESNRVGIRREMQARRWAGRRVCRQPIY